MILRGGIKLIKIQHIFIFQCLKERTGTNYRPKILIFTKTKIVIIKKAVFFWNTAFLFINIRIN
ncbi:MAG: hypothetical protein CFE21_21790 [Bacteroidetes bacterium B1(2017)]|nr:MAG: hypothetical protein CFE21_21790 [Bacteroidetes bacterium B1(2017)]